MRSLSSSPAHGVALTLKGARFLAGTPTYITDGWLVFGTDQGNRVDVSVEEMGRGDIFARIDVRIGTGQFIRTLADFADELGCGFFSPESDELIESNESALQSALENSRAASFCAAPREFLRKLQR